MRKSIRLTAQIAMIVAYYDRIRKNRPLVEPDPTLSHAGNFLYMLNGKKPSPEAERALDVALILHADHELNASTFAARVTAATLSDMHSAMTSAIGALSSIAARRGQRSGVYHAGKDRPIRQRRRRICQEFAGPKQKDSRFWPSCVSDRRSASHTSAPDVTGPGQGPGRTEVAGDVGTHSELVSHEKGRDANVDFYSASTYHALGIDVDLFTPVFAVSRISGWTAHVLEQLADNRLIRPRADYVGPEYRQPYYAEEERKAA